MVSQGIDGDTADCLAARLVEEFAESGIPSPDVGIRTLDLVDECAGTADAGSDGAGDGATDDDAAGDGSGFSDISDFRELASPRDAVDGPYTYGDDADLDALWNACESVSGAACDELFFESPFGSSTRRSATPAATGWS